MTTVSGLPPVPLTADEARSGSAQGANGRAPRPDPDLAQFLEEPEPEYDWIVPGLIERGDRMILTGPEGGGKSTLLRQLAVQVGAGVHPFTLDPIPPQRVLLVDLENSRRHLRRQLRPLWLVPDLNSSRGGSGSSPSQRGSTCCRSSSSSGSTSASRPIGPTYW